MSDSIEYKDFKVRQDNKMEAKRMDAIKRGNTAYNKGLLKGLGFFKLYLYPLLMRR